MYLNANNLYGWVMSQPLPFGGFKWVDHVNSLNMRDTSDEGDILEVDLSYPPKLHNEHDDLPFCAENK